MAHPKPKIQVARTRTRTRVVRPSSARRAARKPRAPHFFARDSIDSRPNAPSRRPYFCVFSPSRVALHQAPPKRAKEKRAQKKSRDTAYKMPREQRDRERERANGTRERKEGKKADANHARLAIVEVVCRFFPSRRARRLPMSREREISSPVVLGLERNLREG